MYLNKDLGPWWNWLLYRLTLTLDVFKLVYVHCSKYEWSD